MSENSQETLSDNLPPDGGTPVERLRREVRELADKVRALEAAARPHPDAAGSEHRARERLLAVACELHRARADALEEALRRETEQGRQALDGRSGEVARALAESERNRRAAAEARRELDAVRQSLTFELGRAMVAGATSPGGFLALPGRLWSVYSRYRARRRAMPAAGMPGPAAADPEALRREARRRRERLDAIRAAWRAGRGGDGSLTAADLRELRVAGVMDTFTAALFEPECRLLQLLPAGCSRQLDDFRPDLVFLESAWRGRDDRWENDVRLGNPGIAETVAWCRSHAVPLVFWNKEDPVHFDWFVDLARECDFVFTTDLDCVSRYRRLLRHDDVHVLPFAAQPRLHNPLRAVPARDAAFFAGSYYARFKERCRDLETVLDAVGLVKPLAVFDRQRDNPRPEYRFPERFGRFIAGCLPYGEMDRVYREYRYGVNINTVKTSPSMFARRVFELLACGTAVVGNYAHGVKTLLGDLTLLSDDGPTLTRELARLDASPVRLDKTRLAGIRAVMREHTGQDRLAQVAATVFGVPRPDFLPRTLVLAAPADAGEARRVLDNFRRQSHPNKRLFLLRDPEADTDAQREGEDAPVYLPPAGRDLWDRIAPDPGDWLGVMSPADYYGPNYLLDLALAGRYADAPVLGKESYCRRRDDGSVEWAEGGEYASAGALPARRAVARLAELGRERVEDWLRDGGEWLFRHGPALTLDRFNYCEAGLAGDEAPETVRAAVDDLPMVAGCGMERLLRQAEAVRTAPLDADDAGRYDARALFAMLDAARRPRGIAAAPAGDAVTLDIDLPDAHAYWYSGAWLDWDRPDASRLVVNMRVHPGRCVSPVVEFADARGKRLALVVHRPNSDSSVAVPAGTRRFRVYLRCSGRGREELAGLALGRFDPARVAAAGFGDYLLVTNVYPSRESLYRHMFVHARVKEYRRAGLNVDVFRLSPEAGHARPYEFEGVECLAGDESALAAVLEKGAYRKILAHFPTPGMWRVLERHGAGTPVVVWLHGGEILPGHRRDYDAGPGGEAARAASERRVAFWRPLLGALPDNLTLVFVSRHFADEVAADYGVRLPGDRALVLPNPIDTDLFAYAPKPPEQRTRILSIRPFASRKYANDLTVRAILALRDEPFFGDLHFRVIGDGVLFEETVAPLAGLRNVRVERGFLTMPEMAELYRDHGVALLPTRHDTHGVSRDEAMAAGLVPVTSRVAAVPEFVDGSCGFLAEAEDCLGLADAVRRLYRSPDLFQRMSAAAHARVLAGTGKERIIPREIELITR